MCGRTSCSRHPNQLRALCTYRNGRSANKQPEVIQGSYALKYNHSPGMVAPAIISSAHLYDDVSSNDRTIVPMQFGLIRNIIGGSGRIINCRAETIHEKPMFSSLLRKGQRCIVLVDGFYEWKKIGNKQKQPYFFYSQKQLKSKKTGGPMNTVTMLAALFDRRPPTEDGQEESYCFSIVTTRPSFDMKPIHDRMPVVLEDEYDIETWLDFKNYSTAKALKVLGPCEDLEYYPVSTKVGNVANNAPELIQPAQEYGLGAFVKKEPRTQSTVRGRSNSRSTRKTRSRTRSPSTFSRKSRSPKRSQRRSQSSRRTRSRSRSSRNTPFKSNVKKRSPIRSFRKSPRRK
ncbi:hypothetical protein ACOME3_001480 [Neoechinorhynchus agilis]